MAEGKISSLIHAFKKKMLDRSNWIPAFGAVGAGVPVNASQLLLSEGSAPDGLKLLYTAPTIPEAEMLRQILEEAGFQTEFVPTMTAAFGISGNPCIYVPAEDYAEALDFLREYQNPAPEALADDADQAIEKDPE